MATLIVFQSKAHTGLVTSLQFGRILHFLGMTVSVEDLKLIVDKFKDRMSGDINYPAFVQAVDYGTVANTVPLATFCAINDIYTFFSASREFGFVMQQ